MSKEWQPFGVSVRGPARELWLIENDNEREAAIKAYSFAKDKKSEAFELEVRINDEGDTEKRERELAGEERARAVLACVYGADQVERLLEEAEA